MARNLVVVESPAKAKTIGKYLGNDYEVVASMGHVRDLPKSDDALNFEGGVHVTYEAGTDVLNDVLRHCQVIVKSDYCPCHHPYSYLLNLLRNRYVA